MREDQVEAVRPESDVRAALNRLFAKLDELNSMLAELDNRLEPVLMERDAKSESITPDGGESPLSREIAHAIAQVQTGIISTHLMIDLLAI